MYRAYLLDESPLAAYVQRARRHESRRDCSENTFIGERPRARAVDWRETQPVDAASDVVGQRVHCRVLAT